MRQSKIAVSMVTLVTIALLVGCVGVPRVVKQPEIVTPTNYEVAGLYLTADAKQMTGVPRDHVKLAVGETVVVYARGMSSIETGGKWFELPPNVVVTWKADRELEVTPATGHIVTVKVVEPITAASFVTATTTDKDGKKIEVLFTVEGKK